MCTIPVVLRNFKQLSAQQIMSKKWSSIGKYAAIIVIVLAFANIVAVMYILSNGPDDGLHNLQHHKDTFRFHIFLEDRYRPKVSRTNKRARESKSLSTASPPRRPLQEQQQQPLSIWSIRIVGGKKQRNRQEVHRLSPPVLAKSDAVLQINDTTVVLVGGYIDKFQNVSSWIQFFDIPSQTWHPSIPIKIPTTVAETHQGIAFDRQRRILYIVSGQKGSGCMPATPVCVRYWMDKDIWEELPPLPMPRYSPGIEIVLDDNNNGNNVSTRSFLHVFGGASENRKNGATDHWRLVLDDDHDIDSEVRSRIYLHPMMIDNGKGWNLFQILAYMEPIAEQHVHLQ
jgi:hypothetical protein